MNCSRTAVSCAFLFLCAAICHAQHPVRPLADEFVVIAESPDPANVYCFTPGLCRLPNGRLVATMDFGGMKVQKWIGRILGTGPGKSAID